MTLDEKLQLRRVREEDRAAVIELIDGVYREYGDRICLTGADADLDELPASYTDRGGEFVVLEKNGQVVGTHAVVPAAADNVCNFRRLYLSPELRGTQVAVRLMQWAIDWAKANGFERVEFWSDTRFSRAHAFFEKFGFWRDGRVREMHDGHAPYSEYFYSLEL